MMRRKQGWARFDLLQNLGPLKCRRVILGKDWLAKAVREGKIHIGHYSKDEI